ncbi:MAG TPA: hypothetical protein VI278_09705 [Nitrososphaeraceae archaeon]
MWIQEYTQILFMYNNNKKNMRHSVFYCLGRDQKFCGSPYRKHITGTAHREDSQTSSLMMP